VRRRTCAHIRSFRTFSAQTSNEAKPVRAELVEARIFSFPTLQNLRQENRLLRREILSGVWEELKEFSLNMIFLANYVVG
jgi:hypothetical protein